MSDMHTSLKEYQSRVLSALRKYLEDAEGMGAATAFVNTTGRPYIAVPGLQDLPYVCLRVPTGGGKTLLAAHSISIAADTWLLTETPVVLWLVPSDPILAQTIAGLKDRDHPTRRALAQRFGERIEILDIEAALYAKPASYTGSAVVIVSTIQAFRQENTDGRRVYAANGELNEHLTTLPADVLMSLEQLEGRPVPSLCNVLRARRPIVVIDEAHGARTRLSFQTLARFSPSLVLEYTATPVLPGQTTGGQIPSNVLYQVSASELKAEHMVKLPVVLRGRADPKQTLADAISWLDHLDAVAAQERRANPKFARPIMLIQAEPKYADRPSLHVEEVERILKEDFQRSKNEIAVSAGGRDDLEGKDLNSPQNGIRFVVTQQKLREGWDCPFAYILCSLTDQRSERAVEQLLGRVLRLPLTELHSNGDLNQAYAFATSRDFVQTAASLRDGLIENGFEEIEARRMISVPEPLPGLGPDGFALRHEEDLPASADASSMAPTVAAASGGRVIIDVDRRKLVLIGALTDETKQAVTDVLPAEMQEALQVLAVRSSGARPAAPVPAAAPFTVPRLVAVAGGLEELFDRSHFLNTMWRLDQCPPEPVLARFAPVGDALDAAVLDVGDQGHVEVTFTHELRQQLSLQLRETGWTQSALVGWLDRNAIGFDRQDIGQASSLVFINRVVEALMAAQGMSLEQVARSKYQLRDAIRRAVHHLRSQRAAQAFQGVLMPEAIGELGLTTSAASALVMTEDQYAYRAPYSGPVLFQKHAFRVVGDLEAQGEEHDCAVHLDRATFIKRWVRNTSQQPNSFWLQTSSDRFYPDFVAELQDGRSLVVEYKGTPYATNDDSREKRLIGQVWADRSAGSGLFAMIENREYAAIHRIVS